MTPGRCYRLNRIRHLVLAGLLTAGIAAADLDRQRQLFIEVYPEVERGNWSVVDALLPAEKRLLSDYVLWPDLRAAFFSASLDQTAPPEIETFLEDFGTLRPVRDLRYRYARHLGDAGNPAEYLAIYERYFQGMGIAELDCLALHAEFEAGHTEEIIGRARALWMTPESQHDACDPVFARLDADGYLDRDAYEERFALTVDAQEFSRARWLARSIDAEHVATATRWLEAQSNPQSFIDRHARDPLDEVTNAQLLYAIERLTYADPVAALDAWRALQRERRFAADDASATARHIALWTARDGLPGAHSQLSSLPGAAQDAEVFRWRARTSLRNGNWSGMLVDIGQMPAAERDAEEWRYWYAIALRNIDRESEGAAILRELAAERSYYGFLAADELGADYALGDTQIPANEALIAELAARTPLIRARELFYVGLDSRGRSEWNALVDTLPVAGKLQAAKLASRWGWHSRAIATAAGAGDFDDLSLRYPLPFKETFAKHAESANISPTWAYGVARSESLFMRDVRSSAGAIGLMQLMPSTGRRVASKLALPYSGLDTLTDPDGNIRLGTSYLGQMAERYDGNRVLATAAYNAGPLRVDRWRPQSGAVDGRVWIETIPFNETRRYVRRVMAADTIFHWRMTGSTRRLRDQLAPVLPAAERLAGN